MRPPTLGRAVGIAVALASTLAVARAVRGGEPASTNLNVLFIIADDLNRSLPCYGRTLVKTPNVDRLAARAVRFDRAYCQYPVCSPSRVSFLSGRRPEQTRMFGNEDASRTPSLKDAVFLPEYFKQQGYFTARVGKVFHIGRDVPECWDVTEEGTPDGKVIYQPQEPDKLGLRRRMVAVKNTRAITKHIRTAGAMIRPMPAPTPPPSRPGLARSQAFVRRGARFSTR